MMRISKVLVLGSGPIKISEAAEFDYSTSQALKALREEGIKSVLINPNVATVQTSYKMADRVYLLPLSAEFAREVIEKERPDGVMIGFGGQSALDLGLDLHSSGVLEKYGIQNLGTPISGIEKALSRRQFAHTMHLRAIETPPSVSARNEEEAIDAGERIGYPLIIRVSFNLGGRGSAVVWNRAQLVDSLRRAFSNSKNSEILVEKYLENWKEVEYEVVRDIDGNTAVVACIENLDPMGVHTGESVAITPAQTLDNYEYQEMRSKAMEVADAIGLIGECNVQFALSKDSYKYYAIETNPRMSRSSALASKATGYPLAYVSAKLALGKRLHEIKNSVSKKTSAMFEPSLDYITIKAPRWDFDKFEGAAVGIGSEMKSIGEVMSIGRSFEEAFQKSVRMLDVGRMGLFGEIYNSELNSKEIEDALSKKLPYWQLYVARAFRINMSVERVSRLSGIDAFFLKKIREIVGEYEGARKKRQGAMIRSEYLRLKGIGFSDMQLSACMEKDVSIKQIDTLSGEMPAKTDYLYTTNLGSEDDIKAGKSMKKRLLIVGAGGFRIGLSVEFDWSALSLFESAKKYFDKVAVINCNPETVSTDWDFVGELYFDEISYESICEIYKKMNFTHVATFTGGQIGNDVSRELGEHNINIIGTSSKSIEIAEDRSKFSRLVERLGISQPQWAYAKTIREAEKFADDFGFPVVIRPSHILGGSAIRIARDNKQLREYFEASKKASKGFPVVVSRYIVGIEAEMDCASDGRSILGITSYQLEESGIHSGDSTAVTPFYGDNKLKGMMERAALDLAGELGIVGPFNIQFIIESGRPSIVELNLRASRSMPFSSKSVGIDIIEYAARGIFDRFDWNGFMEPVHKSFAVKSPQFAWGQIAGAYPHLGPDMKSTGESASFGISIEDALIKSWLGAKPNRIPEKCALVYGKDNLQELCRTADILSKHVDVLTMKGLQAGEYDALNCKSLSQMIASGKIDLVVSDGYLRNIDHQVRRVAADMNVPLVLSAKLGQELAKSMFIEKLTYDEMKEYWR